MKKRAVLSTLEGGKEQCPFQGLEDMKVLWKEQATEMCYFTRYADMQIYQVYAIYDVYEVLPGTVCIKFLKVRQI